MAESREKSRGNVSLPFPAQLALTVLGALAVRGAYGLTQSASAASLVATVLLLALLAQQRRLGQAPPEGALNDWRQIPSYVWPIVLIVDCATVGLAFFLRTAADAGWAAAAIFVGAAATADIFVRASTSHGSNADKTSRKAVRRR